jgi:hypothetical protein
VMSENPNRSEGERIDLVTMERDEIGRVVWVHIDPRWRSQFAASPVLLRMSLQVALMTKMPTVGSLPSGPAVYGRLSDLASDRLLHRVMALADVQLGASGTVETQVTSLRGEVVVTVAGDRIVRVDLSEEWLRRKAVDRIAELITATLQEAEARFDDAVGMRRAELEDTVAEVRDLLAAGRAT